MSDIFLDHTILENSTTIIAMIDRFFLFSLGALFSLLFFILPIAKPVSTFLFEFIAGTLERKLNRTERHASSRKTRGMLVVIFLFFFALLLARLIQLTIGWIVPTFDVATIWVQIPILSLFVASATIWTRQSKILHALDNKKSKQAASLLAPLVQDDVKSSDSFQIRRLAIAANGRAFERYLIGPWFWFVVGGYFFLCLYAVFTAFKFTSAYRQNHSRLYARWGSLLDEVLNFIPARLAGLLLVIGSFLNFRASGKAALRNFLAFRNKIANINAGQTISAIGGATQCLMAGPHTQRKISSEQPWLGDPKFTVKPDSEKLGTAISLHLTTSMALILLAALPIIYIMFY